MVNDCKHYLEITKGCTIRIRCHEGDRVASGIVSDVKGCDAYAERTALPLTDNVFPCECQKDGFCPKFKREMSGRTREICQGINIDLGTAENFRQHWLAQAQKVLTPVSPLTTKCPHLGEPVLDEKGEKKKTACGGCGPGKERQVFNCEHPARKPEAITLETCHTCEYAPRPVGRPIILKNHLSPGDVLVMTAAIRSLHKAHAGKFTVAVDTTCPAIFEHSPDVMPVDGVRAMGGEEIQMHYPAINQADQRGIHFMQGYAEFLSEVLRVHIPLLTNRPHVWLSKQEKGWMDQVHESTGKKRPFWLVNAGVKKDFTTKTYPHYQEVIDRLQGKVLFVQVGKVEHIHPPLRGVIDLRGKTDDRQLIRLAHHCQGVLATTTFLMHLAAAFEKPAVIVAGGREPRQWNQYPLQHFISTVGALPCCQKSACWRSRVVKLNDGEEQDNSLCDNPTPTEPPAAKCMAMISPAEVSEKILLFSS